MRAIGDGVNVAARLSSAAAPGEALVTSPIWEAAAESPERLEERELQLKGREETIRVSVLKRSAAGAPETAVPVPEP